MPPTLIPARMQQFFRTAAVWDSLNPVLAEGEFGIIDSDPPGIKVGDGVTEWVDLPVVNRPEYRTASEWDTDDPVLPEGVLGVISDTSPPGIKVGDGVTAWTSLPLIGGGASSSGVLSHTTASLAADEGENFTLAAGLTSMLLSITSDYPAWVRVYGTAAARTADTRTEPGGDPPAPGTDFYAEVVTTTAPETIRFSPVPIVQGDAGTVYLRAVNMDSVSRVLELDFSFLTLEA